MCRCIRSWRRRSTSASASLRRRVASGSTSRIPGVERHHSSAGSINFAGFLHAAFEFGHRDCGFCESAPRPSGAPCRSFRWFSRCGHRPSPASNRDNNLRTAPNICPAFSKFLQGADEIAGRLQAARRRAWRDSLGNKRRTDRTARAAAGWGAWPAAGNASIKASEPTNPVIGARREFAVQSSMGGQTRHKSRPGQAGSPGPARADRWRNKRSD